MLDTFDCHDDPWLQRLYKIREKWSGAYNKDYFSGGVISSQRSESTNHAISRNLTKTASLCDFYKVFNDVISGWRSNENADDFRCKQGYVNLMVVDSKLLKHASEVYSIEIFMMFEAEFLKGMACVHENEEIEQAEDECSFFVWHSSDDTVRHRVLFNKYRMSISCSCKMITEVGILCRHCLRIFNIFCVEKIPECYILPRWRKDVSQRTRVGFCGSSSNSDFDCGASIWKTQMIRRFVALISASERNKKAQIYCEEGFERMRSSVVSEVGAFEHGDFECDSGSNSDVRDLNGRRQKGERNVRRKSLIEKKCKQAAKGKKWGGAQAAKRTKKAVESLIDSGFVIE